MTDSVPFGDAASPQSAHDPESEIAVLGAMLNERAAANEVRDLLSPEDFYTPTHRTIFSAALRAIDRTGALDLIILRNQLESDGTLDQVGGIAALAAISESVASAANVRAHTRLVREATIKRKFLDVTNAASREGHDAQDVTRAIEDYKSALDDLSAFDQESEQVRRAGDIAGDTLDWLDAVQRAEGGLIGIPTGLEAFDRLTYGLQKQRLYLLAARPAVGKSLVALHFARQMAASGLTVAFFSLEMGATEVLTRLLAAQGKVDNERMSTGNLDDLDWKKLTEATADLAAMQLFIDDDPGLTVASCKRRCERIRTITGRLDIVFIDYLQLMESVGGGARSESRQQDVSAISRGLKLMSKALDVPVVTLSQLSRQVEQRPDKRPGLADLRESGSLEQDADVVVMAYRDELYDETSPDKGLIELLVRKNRAGRTGIAKAAFMPHLYRIGNLASHAEPGDLPPTPAPTPF